MLYNDQPIREPDEDALNRQPFVDKIAELINNYTKANAGKNTHDGLVIGLEGPWGSGKTSILNLLEKKLEALDSDYLIKRYDSWLTLDRTSIAVEFFKTLEYDAVSGSTAEKSLKYDVKEIAKETAHQIGKFGLSFSIPLLKIKPDWEHVFDDVPLWKQKKDIEEILSKSKRYIIYMIDDIDRLRNEDIAFVMQLVKNIADFPKIIYILAYDHDIVNKALNHTDGDNGRDFMEKIVQVPIQMPMFSEQDLLNYFGKELRKIIPEESYTENKAIYYTTAGKAVENRIHKALLPYLRSIRDCNRVLNAFQVRYLSCSQFCNADDLLCIVVLSIYEPQLISYIIDHPDSAYLQGINHQLNPSRDVSEKYREEFKIKAHCADDALIILAILFPCFSRKAALYITEETPDSEAVITNRISIKSNFSSYFILSGREDDVLSSSVEYLLKDADETSIQDQFVAWAKNGQWTGACSKLVSYCDTRNKRLSLTKDRLKILLYALSLLKDNPLFDQQLHPYADLAWCFLEKTTKYSPFSGTTIVLDAAQQDMLTEIFEDRSISIEILEALMKPIGRGYGWNPSEANGSYLPLADKDVFEACRDIFLRRNNPSISDIEGESKK